ncbi:MAG: bifunctional diguanylate cyclase/phosphodiesterase [Bacteroidales bacterium]|nr:bifunctional diguanylate cyclase/phosphodiesterase [Clostridium sp.]MCM1203500.1 bifunctional diguanylate cyclase/phosphodiesterase [Bacteroidales bacterium]
MQWNMDFDICALVLLGVIILLYGTRRFVSIRRNYIFSLMVFAEVATVVLNMAIRGILAGMSGQPGGGVILLIHLYYAVQYVIPIFLLQYMIVWSGQTLKSNLQARFFLLLPMLVYAVEIIRNFAFNCLFYFDARYGYWETEEINILNAMTIYCMLVGMVYGVKYARMGSFGKLALIALIGVIIGVAAVVQSSMPGVVFIDFVVAVALLVLYLVAQNPSDMLDNNTQVFNRNMMDELLSVDILSRHNFNLIVLALDDFKFVNKTFGVAVGDMMLMQVAHFLTTLNRRGKVYRYGSDQFALQVVCGEAEETKLLEQIQERFRHPWITEDVSVMMSTTITCLSYPEDGDSLANIIDVIDYSILSAKTGGKGSVVFARDMDLQGLREEKAIEKAIETAIDRDTIEVYYQPIFNTEKQCYTSAEALVRLKDETLGNISPEIFIPIAEKNGMIVKLGTMIFEKVCRFMSEHNLKDTSIEYIEVNVSVVQCMQSDFVENLIDIMDYYHILPEQINLEVTETAAVNSLSVLQQNIEKLHAHGISFSLDDYGSGYSTLGYLHQLPFQIIKLDKLMVWDAFENERAGITLKYTVGMLKELKVHIVAEGVETQEQQSHLSNIGCDYLQGWYYSKAIPEKEFARLIREAC